MSSILFIEILYQNFRSARKLRRGRRRISGNLRLDGRAVQVVLSSFTAPRGPHICLQIRPHGERKRDSTNFFIIQRTSLQLNPLKADRNIFIKIITHSRWSFCKIISIKIFKFAMQNYKSIRYSLYKLNSRRATFTFSSGEGGPRAVVVEESTVYTAYRIGGCFHQ